MELRSLAYVQFEGAEREWRIERCSFGGINLIVGKNATGKTRILNVIKGLGNLVSGDEKLRYISGDYDVDFTDGATKTTYRLKYEGSEVTSEEMWVGRRHVLRRSKGGEGNILAVKEGKKGRMLRFQTPERELACANRRDSLQHPFFEPLYQWGRDLRHYPFGSQLGKDHLVVFVEGKPATEVSLKDPNCAVALFRKGQKEFPKKFAAAVVADMSAIGYDLRSIRLSPPQSIVLPPSTPGTPQCILVKEADLPGATDQRDMSQGMFRALSLLIHLNYSELAGAPSCILIDDIGEGLDYERSSALIGLLVGKAKGSAVQLIMTTNDRFVMNNVPLQYWCVVQRLANGCSILNYENSRRAFDQFELTGLSNFDFFAGDFLEAHGAKR